MTKVRKAVPWWLRISIKIILSRMPITYSLWQRVGLFRHGRMDRSDYAIQVFNRHAVQISADRYLFGKTVLELGPGDSIATAILAKAHGGQSILVDAGNFVRADVRPYLILARVLSEQGFVVPDLSNCRTTTDILDKCDSRYLTAGLTSLRQLEGGSVDLIFSQAVLEHVHKNDFLETMLECRRILKAEGICSHQIDLRDHLGGALNNLRFSSAVWESKLFLSSGFYTNRIRYSQMIGFMEHAGFKVRVTDVGYWEKLPTPRSKLSTEFCSLDEDDLLVNQFDVVLSLA